MQVQLEDFLKFLRREQNYSKNTTDAYRNDLNQFLRYVTSDHPSLSNWEEVDNGVIEDYVQDLTNRPYASSSIARKVAAVKSFFHFLFAKGNIAKDPTKLIDSPRVEKRVPATLSTLDVEKLLKAPTLRQTPKHLRDAALLAVLYATGMRVTELVSLSVSDLHMTGNEIRFEGKSGDVRTLAFDNETSNIIQRYLMDGRPHLIKADEETSLFLNHRGQQLTRQGLWLIIKAYAKQVNLSQDVTPHTLRHSFASHKLNNGTNLEEVQQLLGHANISTTQIYTQLPADNI